MFKRVFIASIAALLLALAGTGCNTVKGAGEDIQSVGETVSGDR